MVTYCAAQPHYWEGGRKGKGGGSEGLETDPSHNQKNKIK